MWQYKGVPYTVEIVDIHGIANTVEPPRKGHFGTNINSSDLSPL